jgi:hypothetical protein
MDLGMEGKNVGAFIVLAKGSAVFTKEHAERALLLRGPFSIAMSNALRYEELVRLKEILDIENRELSRELRRRHSGGEIIGAEFGLKKIMDMVRQVAPLDSPVILLGETGQKGRLRLEANQLKTAAVSHTKYEEAVADFKKAEPDDLEARLGYDLAVAELNRIAGTSRQ